MPYRPPQRSKQRKFKALEMRFGGATYRTIAQELGITFQRAQQLLRPRQEVFEYLREKAVGKCEHCQIEIKRGDVHDRLATGLTPDSYHKLENLAYFALRVMLARTESETHREFRAQGAA